MVYLILQIVWFLVAAAAIGFAVGWLCSSATISRRREAVAMQARAAQGEFEGQREQLEARLAEATSARTALQEELAQVRQAAETDAKARRKLEREHNSAVVRLQAREREVARLTAELQTGRGDLAAPQTAPLHPPLETAEEPSAAPPPLAAPQGEADDGKRVSASGRASKIPEAAASPSPGRAKSRA